MPGGHRRHAKASGGALRRVVAWGQVGLALACGMLIGFGVPWPKAVFGSLGLLAILLIAYGLERSGLMRLPNLDEPAPPGTNHPQTDHRAGRRASRR